VINQAEKNLLLKIKNRKARIAIVGMGYVGLPLACEFSEKGFHIIGIDVDRNRVDSLLKGKSYIEDIPSARLAKLVRAGLFKASSDYGCLESEVDIVIICVPTPLSRSRDPDISYIVSAVEEIQKRIPSLQLVILESTTYPGTTEEVILPALERAGHKVGKDFFLCFSPERIDPGNKQFKPADIPKVVGGVTPACTRLAAALYGQVMPEIVKVSSPRTAEMTKILENTFRIVNIGLVNELAMAAESLQVNIWEAIDAAKTKPFGYMPFYPGPGIGGHCIGVDPIYLSWKARMHGTDLQFIELARKVNATMPHHVVSQAVYTLNQYRGKAIARSKVLVLGIAYKRDVADTRESPALDILEELKKLGASVSYHDPYVPQIKQHALSLKSQPLTAAILKKQDLVILTTAHTCFDRKKIAANAGLIYDTRNFFKGFEATHIVRL